MKSLIYKKLISGSVRSGVEYSGEVWN